MIEEVIGFIDSYFFIIPTSIELHYFTVNFQLCHKIFGFSTSLHYIIGKYIALLNKQDKLSDWIR